MTSVAPSSSPGGSLSFRLEPASAFSMAELTRAYNQARADYLIPMQMDARHLASYIQVYDVDLAHSWAAVAGEKMIGLAMLGVRRGGTWITRLGVLAEYRRSGAGAALVEALLAETTRLGRSEAVLEVVQGNQPALALFQRAGFRATRELLILRRPPGPLYPELPGRVVWLEQVQVIERLHRLPDRLPWTNAVETFINAGDGLGLEVDLGQAGRGWMVFRRQRRLLSHFVARTVSGEPGLVARALLAHLYHRFPRTETYIENIPATDEQLATLWQAGFVETFRRIEMAGICHHPGSVV